ncbi:MAG TPA: hypothetical protein VJP82_03830 [Sphingomicrobium sp.]|jgi:hypothetical protein|nr:hypothetical protein [Sphingomicrobium sp.]
MRLVVIVGFIALAGCGRVSDLKPEAGHSLPVKPLLARATPTADELLTPPTYARPDRVDELMKRSTARKADPFDLPPATGGAAPALPAGTDLTPVTDDTGPVKPQ